MKYDLYEYCIDLLSQRGVTIDAMAELVLFSQKKYYPTLTMEDATYAIQRVLKKREVQNVIMTGIELDKFAEEKKLSEPFQKIMEKDNPLYGIDEVIVFSILNLYGSIGFTNYGYLDKFHRFHDYEQFCYMPQQQLHQRYHLGTHYTLPHDFH